MKQMTLFDMKGKKKKAGTPKSTPKKGPKTPVKKSPKKPPPPYKLPPIAARYSSHSFISMNVILQTWIFRYIFPMTTSHCLNCVNFRLKKAIEKGVKATISLLTGQCAKELTLAKIKKLPENLKSLVMKKYEAIQEKKRM